MTIEEFNATVAIGRRYIYECDLSRPQYEVIQIVGDSAERGCYYYINLLDGYSQKYSISSKTPWLQFLRCMSETEEVAFILEN